MTFIDNQQEKYTKRRLFDIIMEAQAQHSCTLSVEVCVSIFRSFWFIHGKKVKLLELEIASRAENEEVSALREKIESMGFAFVMNSFWRERMVSLSSSPGIYISVMDYAKGRLVSACYVEEEEKEVEEIFKKLKKAFPAKDSITIRTFESDKGPDRQLGSVIDAIDRAQSDLAHPSFYPWLTLNGKPVTVEEYAEAYMASSANILLIYGPPGTGKSTFIRTLMFCAKKRNGLVYNEELMGLPYFALKAFNVVDLLAMEDCDNILRSRANGNHRLQQFLNASDGLVKKKGKGKLVLSTNLASIDEVDTAVTRPGRCFDVLYFRELTHLEAAAVADSIGKKDLVFEQGSEWTLGQIVANSPRETMMKKSKVGFC